MTCKHKSYKKDNTKKSKEILDFSIPKPCRQGTGAIYLGFKGIPHSDEANAFVDDLGGRLHTGRHKNPSPNSRDALGTIVADLLDAVNAGGYAYRIMTAGSFTDEPIGHHCARVILEHLEERGMIQWIRGTKMRSGKASKGDVASRFIVKQPLLDAAAAHGITPDNWPDHFVQRPRSKTVKKPVTLRKKRAGDWFNRPDRGENMKVDLLHPRVAQSKMMLDDINRFLYPTTIEYWSDDRKAFVGCHLGFKRIFAQGDMSGYNYDKGGRIYSLYGGYQSLSKTDRSTIRINGEPTVELDIRACQLAILHALEGMPLNPEVDPYNGIGTDRDVAKTFIMQTLGNDKLPTNWSKSSAKKYGEKNEGRCLYCDHPFEPVKKAVLDRFPLLTRWDSSKIRWGDLQFQDSEVIFEAVHALVKLGISSLPVHDSLIVARSKEKEARATLAAVFQRRIGVDLFIK